LADQDVVEKGLKNSLAEYQIMVTRYKDQVAAGDGSIRIKELEGLLFAKEQ
jgi:hypothetical protein